jgi:hypothetical protein
MLSRKWYMNEVNQVKPPIHICMYILRETDMASAGTIAKFVIPVAKAMTTISLVDFPGKVAILYKTLTLKNDYHHTAAGRAPQGHSGLLSSIGV